MECFAHVPSPFIYKHFHRLLPDWPCPAASVLIVLQPCAWDLSEHTPQTEHQKQQLRQRFLQFGYRVATKLQTLGYLADVFDPRTGLPLFSQPGQIHLDDVAVVQFCLGYSTLERQGCSILLHPLWGSAVYPSILLSSATPPILEQVSQEVREDCPSEV